VGAKNPLITFEPFSGFGHEILYGGDDIEDDLDCILLNAVASTIPKWKTFKLLGPTFEPIGGFG
jgi:hypothetical protein